MAITYLNLASTTLGSAQASITLSSISQSYTDLLLRMSLRTDGGGAEVTGQLRFNGVSTGNYGSLGVRGAGSDASALTTQTGLSTNGIQLNQGLNASSATASTFSNLEFYLPSYATSTRKVLGYITCSENYSGIAYTWIQGGAFTLAQAVSSITVVSNSGNFVAGSSVYIYGIKNL